MPRDCFATLATTKNYGCDSKYLKASPNTFLTYSVSTLVFTFTWISTTELVRSNSFPGSGGIMPSQFLVTPQTSTLLVFDQLFIKVCIGSSQSLVSYEVSEMFPLELI